MNFLQQFWGAVRVCSALLLAACGTLVLLPLKERFHKLVRVQCDSLNSQRQSQRQGESKQQQQTSNLEGITVHNYCLKEVDNLWLGL